MARAEEDTKDRKLDGWLLSLNYPTYDAIMTHAHDRSLRETLYRAWSTRGSDMGDDPEWDNSDNIERILLLRHEVANLVGYASYADYSLATKMAGSSDEVLEFLQELSVRSRSAAEQELADLQEFAGMELAPWDMTFWLEKFKQAKFSVSNEDLRQYFPSKTVISGLFLLAAVSDRSVELRNLGIAQLENEKPSEASDTFVALTLEAPKEPLGWANLAIARLRSQQTEEALQAIGKALELAPQRADLLAIRADIEQWQGGPEQALATYMKAARLAPDNAEIQYALYRVASTLQDPAADEGVDLALENLARLRPDNLVVMLHLG